MALGSSVKLYFLAGLLAAILDAAGVRGESAVASPAPRGQRSLQATSSPVGTGAGGATPSPNAASGATPVPSIAVSGGAGGATTGPANAASGATPVPSTAVSGGAGGATTGPANAASGATPVPSIAVSGGAGGATTGPANVASGATPVPSIAVSGGAGGATTGPANAASGATPVPNTFGFAPATLAPWSTLPPLAREHNAAPSEKSSSDSTPIIAGVVAAVVGAALIALVVFLARRRRRGTTRKVSQPSPPLPGRDNGNLEQGRDEPPTAQPPSYEAMLALGSGGDKSRSHQHAASHHRHTPVEDGRVQDGDQARSSASTAQRAAIAGMVQSSTERATDVVCGAAVAGADTDCPAERSLPATASVTTSSAADVSRDTRVELAELIQRAAGAASFAGGPQSEQPPGGIEASTVADRNKPAGDIGLGHAVLAAAQELAHHCQVPGVSEAAAVLCIMANLVTDSCESDSASDSRLRRCRSIVVVLQRAAEVVGKAGDTTGEAAHNLIEDVHDAISDLVELIKTFQSKNKLSKVFLSTLFKRRQDELVAVVDRAIMHLQLGLQSTQLSLQLQVGHDVSAVKDDVRAVKEGMHLYESSMAPASSESVAEARRTRRQRKLDLVEIPEDNVFLTDDLLGKGGFGEVYLADYNGHNAAAKVLRFAHDVGAVGESEKKRETSQRRAFLREMEAMIRLRSPNTVRLYGAVTSLPDRMVLVMELLVGGDLLTMLNKSEQPLPEQQSRRILGDICTGMAFLHSKNTVHGDLKSANVLLDGEGRAKIGDFGSSRWSQHTNSTGLATYTKSSRSTQMSLAWSAPEVLEDEGGTYASDVYSFGIVVWEVLARKRPWENKARPREILSAVLRGKRPSFHADAPADIVDIANACWLGEPEQRTTFSALLEGMRADGWVCCPNFRS